MSPLIVSTQETWRTRVIARGGAYHHTMAMENKPAIRPTARVLLLDDQDRVLLFCGQDATNPSMRFWFPAGGGIEPGETAEEAARREVLEETGFADLVLVYKAVELYKEGKKETAFQIFSSLKLNHEDNQKLKLEDWLSAANIIPDSVIYRYNL